MFVGLSEFVLSGVCKVKVPPTKRRREGKSERENDKKEAERRGKEGNRINRVSFRIDVGGKLVLNGICFVGGVGGYSLSFRESPRTAPPPLRGKARFAEVPLKVHRRPLPSPLRSRSVKVSAGLGRRVTWALSTEGNSRGSVTVSREGRARPSSFPTLPPR